MLAMNVEPGESMGIVKASIDLNRAIALVEAGSRLESGSRIAARFSPIEPAGTAYVKHHLPQSLRREFGPHAVSPRVNDAAAGLRSPSASGAGVTVWVV